MMQDVTVRTGVWYDDRPTTLSFPDSWDVVTHWPDTPAPLTDREIVERMLSPVNQKPLRELARGRRRPVIVTDDLARPTPVFRLIPFVLDELQRAGIAPTEVRIVVATGTHGKQSLAALANKLGPRAMESCRIIVHSDLRHCKYVGRTSFGTPVHLNRDVADSDLLIGIGGVYPQHTVGFGGGAKLALGVLARTSIRHLHFRHSGGDGSYSIDNDFRKDVTEIARLIGLQSIFTVHINANLEVVNLMAGDHFSYYRAAADFSKSRYTAPLPQDADVVIANGYPSDVSYTFMRKGIKPVTCASERATRIMVASNPEGVGHHGLFPQGGHPRLREAKELYNRLAVMEPKVIASKLFKKVFRRGSRTVGTSAESPAAAPPRSPLLLYRPGGDSTPMPHISGVEMVGVWADVLEIIRREHPGKDQLKVRIYPCASLQCLDT